MTHNFDGYNYLIRLEMGERLSEVFEQFFAETKIEGGWVSGVGTANEVQLGFYELNAKDYKWRTFGRTMEIVSLSGNIARDDQGKMMYHLHGVFASSDYTTAGGHVRDFIAAATVELFIHRTYQPMYRKLDQATGLQLLDLG